MALQQAWSFGPPITSQDYMLVMPQDASNPNGPLWILPGVSLGAPSQNTTDVLEYVETRYVKGRAKPVAKVLKPAEVTSMTMTIGFKPAIMTPLIQRAISGGCKTDLYMKYLCPTDVEWDHYFVLPEGDMNPPVEATDPIQVGTDREVITQTAEFRVPERILGFRLGGTIVSTIASTPLHDIAFMSEDCPGCSDDEGQELLVGGGDGTAVPALLYTDNRFQTNTARTTGGAATDVIQSVFTSGDLVITNYLVAGTPDTGTTAVSSDRGVTVAAVAGNTAVYHRIKMAGDRIVFVGGLAGTGAAKLAYSDNYGATITEITSTVLPDDEAIVDFDYDPDTGNIYAVCDGGSLLKIRFNGSSASIVDITANLATVATSLNSVLVRMSNNVVIGGASGYLAETFDGGVNWSAMRMPSSSTVKSIAGNRYRMWLVAGTSLFEYSLLTDNSVKAVPLSNGQTVTGTYTRIVQNLEGDINRFAAVTDDGEIVFLTAFVPNW